MPAACWNSSDTLLVFLRIGSATRCEKLYVESTPDVGAAARRSTEHMAEGASLSAMNGAAGGVVRGTGIEPARPAASGPKPGASTNSATRAKNERAIKQTGPQLLNQILTRLAPSRPTRNHAAYMAGKASSVSTALAIRQVGVISVSSPVRSRRSPPSIGTACERMCTCRLSSPTSAPRKAPPCGRRGTP